MRIPKKRIEMRIAEDIKTMAERASAATGCTLTEYITRLISEDAPHVLKMHNEIELTNDRFDHFISVCKSGKPPSPRIMDAAKRLDNEGF